MRFVTLPVHGHLCSHLLLRKLFRNSTIMTLRSLGNKHWRRGLAVFGLVSAFAVGAAFTESEAEAYTCANPGNTPPTPCKCGSLDLGPDGSPLLPAVEWFVDCNHLAAACAGWHNPAGGTFCSFTPDASGGGGTCTCV